MIITNIVELKLDKRLIDKYNYNGKSGDIIKIHPSKLPEQSTIMIRCKCDICGEERELQYRMYNKNYKKYNLYTCDKCSTVKRKKTSLEKYGVDNPMKSEIIKSKVKKTNLDKFGVEQFLQSKSVRIKIKETNLKKYGVDNPMKNEDIKNKSLKKRRDIYGYNLEEINDKIKKTKKEKYDNEFYVNSDKIKETNLKKYGVEYPLQSKDIYEKSISTMFDKYGNYPFKSDEIRGKMSKTLKKTTFNKIKEKYKDVKFIDKQFNKYIIQCDICKNIYEIDFNLFHLRSYNNSNLCTICNDPKNNSISEIEKELFSFIKNNYDGEIISNDRKILNGKELDIYIPELKIAFEFNGLYWHSEYFKNKNFHRNKYDECNLKNIDLIFIWEDDWNYKKDIIKSMILNKLGKISNKIYARKTKIKEINDNKLIRKFLDNNHIQGFSKSSIKIGLFYEDELVSLMTFGNRRINKNKEFELIRFCSKLNTNVVGGANKLFNYFKQNFDYDDIYSYSDNSFFNGDLYKNLNFKFLNETSTNYYWVVNNKRYHRFVFNKKSLIKKGFDKNLTEVEIMHSINNYRIWSNGQKKWIYKNDKK